MLQEEMDWHTDFLKSTDLDYLYFQKIVRNTYKIYYVFNNRINTITYLVSFIVEIPYNEDTMTVTLKGNKQVAMMLIARNLETALDMEKDSISWREL